MAANFDKVLNAELEQIRCRRKLSVPVKSPPVSAPAKPPGILEQLARGAKNQVRALKASLGKLKDAKPEPEDHTAQRAKEIEETLDKIGKAQTAALEMKLFGLAFSGGGIRSATFNLGVIQRLAKHQLVSQVDYLSTVSGGGYIGSWLTAWIAREGHLSPTDRPGESVRNVEKQLPPSRVTQAGAKRRWLKVGRTVPYEPEPVFHLREYSNYLSPKVGFFSADSWTLIAIYVRNLLLNQVILLGWAILATLVIRIAIWFFTLPSAGWSWLAAIAALVSLIVSLALFTRELTRVADPKTTSNGITEKSLHFMILGPLLGAAILITWLLTTESNAGGVAWAEDDSTRFLRIPPLPHFGPDLWQYLWDGSKQAEIPWIVALAFVAPLAILNGIVNLVACCLDRFRSGAHRAGKWQMWVNAAAGFTSGGIGGLLLFIAFACVLWPAMGESYSPALIATIGPPLLFCVFLAAAFTEVGLLGREITEAEREWWARVCAWCLIYAISWLLVFGVSTFGLLGFVWLIETYHAHESQIWTGATLSWLATTIGGALAGKSSSTKDGRGNPIVEWVGLVAPYVFIVGLAVLVSAIVSKLLGGTLDLEHFWEVFAIPYWTWFTLPGGIELILFNSIRFWLLVGVTAGLVVLLTWRVDINLFSLHSMYANRLIRCYLGASRQKSRWDKFVEGGYRGGAPTHSNDAVRHENPVTGLDAVDDFPLRNLRIGEEDPEKVAPAYWGPFPIINTAMNLVAGTELAWQERKAESFVFTPLYCGSRITGYQKIGPESDDQLTLGRAVGISGAAASPNMGYHTSPPLTALMAAFNVRLGWWLQNPQSTKEWGAVSPGTGTWLLRELFGQTNEKCDFLYLSDGGHFENLGIYELVRRRCRFIIACDAGADPGYAFEDLAGAIRKCRSDFGVRIELDVSDIRPDAATGRSHIHCAVGTIRYSDVHSKDKSDKADKPEHPDKCADFDERFDGIIVYIKASLTGDEDSDILSYKDAHPFFPHETTADQFFNESQFESYRALGDHVMAHVLRERAGEIAETPLLNGPKTSREGVEKLFKRLHKFYKPIPREVADRLGATSEGYVTLQEVLRGDKDLFPFSKALYESLVTGAPDDKARETLREIHFTCQLLQVLENAWLVMRLDDYAEHPMTAGWMSFVRRCASLPNVNNYWEGIQGEFSEGFCEFFNNLRPKPPAQQGNASTGNGPAKGPMDPFPPPQ